jgi:hypothetical protein
MMAAGTVSYEERRVHQWQPSRWRRIGMQALWFVGIVVAISAVVFVINRFFVHRPLWDWLELLIVPAVLAGGGLWFNAQQREREQRIANERAQDEALQAYLDQMSDLLIPNEDRPSLYDEKPPESLRSVARARTLTVLPRLDGDRKARVVQFLYESGLIAKRRRLDLSRADLSGADLSEADLSGADLSKANLGPPFTTVNIETNLRGANLREARLYKAILFQADLSGADLSGATVLTNQLEQAKSLEGTTMPNGHKYVERPLQKYTKSRYPELFEDKEGSGEDG